MNIHPVVVIWLLCAGPAWAALGAWGLPRVYRRKGLEDAPARFIGVIAGFTLGPLALAPLWRYTPGLRRWYWSGGTGVLAAVELYGLFAFLNPNKLSVTHIAYVGPLAANVLPTAFF